MSLETLRRGCVDLVSAEELERKLGQGRSLRVKLGVDPTSPDLHLGHTVVFQKLRAFQDLGHVAVLILGDFTARVGDPSGRDATRPTLGPEEIKANAETYREQALRVLRADRLELRWNSEWLEPFLREGLLRALARFTVGQLLEREDFRVRMKEASPITLLEMLYPILQGYDSVAVRADVELGGGDQLFNLLMGRQMQKDAGQEPQVILTLPLLVGLDGQRKMSKSYGNHIALKDPPRELFGKVMKLPDALLRAYYELLTDADLARLDGRHPMQAKLDLAELLTSRFHGDAAGPAERAFFSETFSERKTPQDVAEVRLARADRALAWSAFLARIGAAPSRKQAQRLIAQGAVRADDVRLEGDVTLEAYLGGLGREPGTLSLKVGKHQFFKLRVE